MKYAAFFALAALLAGCNQPAAQQTPPVAATTPAAPAAPAAVHDLQGPPDSTAVRALKDFPASQLGYVRYVVLPPALPDRAREQVTQLEIIPGKLVEVDCNRHGLMGSFAEKTVAGFGYQYYVFSSNGQVNSTMMGCPDNRRTTEFVSGETRMLRYNSRLPVVVFVPKGLELKYRFWQAGPLQAAATR